jgi:outer membrane murein-binding lipoprotein Lpp
MSGGQKAGAQGRTSSRAVVFAGIGGAALASLLLYGLAVQPNAAAVATLRAELATEREKTNRAETEVRTLTARQTQPMPDVSPTAQATPSASVDSFPPDALREGQEAALSGWIDALKVRENAVRLQQEGQELQRGQLDAQLTRLQQMQTQTEAMLARLRTERQQGNRPMAVAMSTGVLPAPDPRTIAFTASLPPDMLSASTASGAGRSFPGPSPIPSSADLEMVRPGAGLILSDRPMCVFRTMRRDAGTATVTLRHLATGATIDTATVPIPPTGDMSWRTEKPLKRGQVYEWLVSLPVAVNGSPATPTDSTRVRFRVADAATARRENGIRLERAAILMRAGLLDAAADLLQSVRFDAPGTPEAAAADRGLRAISTARP